MFSIKDDLMVSPKVVFLVSVLLPQPQRLCIPFSPQLHLSLSFASHIPPSPPHHTVPHTRNLLQVQPTTVGEHFNAKAPLQTTTNWNHFHLENSQLLQMKGRLISWITYIFFKAFYTYLRERVRAPNVHSGICVHRCTRISLSQI